MQLALQTDYSLRVLLMLGANPNRRITLTQLSDIYAISKEHLRKVVHGLAKLGVITTYRGKNGGIELKQAPHQINIGEIVAAIEPRNPVVNCFAQPCKLSQSCELRGVLAGAENAFYMELSKYTLRDIVEARSLSIIRLDA